MAEKQAQTKVEEEVQGQVMAMVTTMKKATEKE